MNCGKNKKKTAMEITDLVSLRTRAAAAGIFSIAELARQVPCARVSIYFAIERPSRFPKVTSRIKELLDV